GGGGAAGAGGAPQSTALFATPVSFDFGLVPVGDTAPPQTADIFNSGPDPIALLGSADAAEAPFGAAQGCLGGTLGPGESCRLTFDFAPLVAGPSESTFSIVLNDETFSFALSGVGSSDGSPRTLALSASPLAFDFGDRQVGTETTYMSVITNRSGSPLVMSGAGGGTPAPLSTTQACQALTLNPGETCTMNFRFMPTATGPATATSNITWNGQPFSFDLRGTGAAPQLRAEGSALDFGEVEVGTTMELKASIINVGADSVTMSGAGGGVSSPFAVTQNCQGLTLAPGDSCEMTFRFMPTSGGAATATSNITWSGVPFSFVLSGVGLSDGPLRITPVGFDFGPVALGATSSAQVTEVTNISDAAVAVTALFGAVAEPFDLTEDCQGQLLNPGESCQLSYRFSPTTAGIHTATVDGVLAEQSYSTTLRGRGVASP
ncbi:MAG: choice-of-anchor D domain-containing protein, partial [Polyangiales bacterium]